MFYAIKRWFIKSRLDVAILDSYKLDQERIELLERKIEIQDKLIALYQKKLEQHDIKF